MTAISQLTIRRPDDWHVHLRDGAMLAAVAPHSARTFNRVIVMPNLVPPVTTASAAADYRRRIVQAAHATNEPDVARPFTPLMTCYLTDACDPNALEQGFLDGVFAAAKLYPAGATTNSASGVTDIAKIDAVLARMEKIGMPLLIHGEVTDAKVDVFDREAVFIERILIPTRKKFPHLKIVFEHITTKEAVQYVKEADGPTAATITAHHLLYNRNAMFTGGVRPHYYCLPVLKRETHRQALIAAATSGNPKFFLGTDSAPHAKGLKEHACGCAGCYTALHAMELYAQAFEQADALDKLEAFASFYGADFYGLPRNEDKVTLERATWNVPEELPMGDTTVVPLDAGQSLNWKFV